MATNDLDDSSDRNDELEAAFAEARIKIEARLREYTPTLGKCSVVYEGSGDEGSFIDMTAEDSAGTAIILPADIQTEVEEVVDQFVQIHHSDYDFGEGGGGTVVIDLDKASWSLSAYNNVVEKEKWEITV